MAFLLYASVADVTTQLNDGNPFRFESAEGLSGIPVTRYAQRGPLQSGVSDMGFRLQPRTLTLNLIFTAIDDATLDSYRDQLAAAFKPLGDISTFLSVQRDDDEIRTLTCHRVGDIAISLTPELRPGHTHRATLQLRAAAPLWRGDSATSGEHLGEWWLAGGSIDPSNVLEHVEYPGTAQLYAGSSVTAGSPWSVVAKHKAAGGIFARYLFDTQSGRAILGFDNETSSTRRGVYLDGSWSNASIFFGGVDRVAMLVNSGTSATTYNGTASAGSVLPGTIGIGGTTRWRSAYNGTAVWTDLAQGEVQRAAAYNIALSSGQRTALYNAMIPASSGTVQTVNSGDVAAFPVVYIYGPVTDPVVTNATTGQSIDLSGVTLDGNEYAIIDLRTGNKSIRRDGVADLLGDITAPPIGVANFHLRVGTNYLALTGGSVGTAAYMYTLHTNEYMSF